MDTDQEEDDEIQQSNMQTSNAKRNFYTWLPWYSTLT